MNTADKKNTANRASIVLFAVTQLCQWLGVVVLFSMMTLTGVDVIARYVFNRPISGAFELVEIMLALLVFLAFPASIRFDSHIKVELISSFGSTMVNRFVQWLVSLLSLGIFSVLTYQLYRHAERLKSYGQVTNSLEIPLYLVGFLASACCLICVLLLTRAIFLSEENK